MFRRLVLTTALLASLAAPLQAQTQVGLSAFAGSFLPVGELFDELRLAGQIIANVSQDPGLAIGGRVTVWMSRFAIDAEAGYALSNVDLPESIVELGLDNSASTFVGSVNVLYVIFQAPFSPLRIYVSGGGGLVSRSGDFFDLFQGTTDVAGTLGIGLRFGLGRATQLRFDVRDYISSFAATRRDEEFDSQLQNDLIATIGLEFVFRPVE
ncbi:MAG: outer membrane beta-barrel protein [Gemmatimonadota bacterium]|nr:MAG: outer membrane beta-barrel protein [Gemmatimonadota bacterium]